MHILERCQWILLTGTMTDICSILFDKSFGQLVQAVKVVARIRDLRRLEAQPPHHLFNRDKVLLLLALRVRVVKSQITIPAMVSCKPKVDSNGFAVSNVQEPIWLRRKLEEGQTRASYSPLGEPPS